jgi:hypothetical protein
MKNEPIVEHYRDYTIHLHRVKGLGGRHYFTATGYRRNHQSVYSYGPWDSCMKGIRALIDEELRIDALLKMRLSQAQSA